MRLPFSFKKKISAKVASRRLKQLLMADRIHCPGELTDSIYSDMVSVLGKYIEIDTKNIDVRITQKENQSRSMVPVLAVYAPLKEINRHSV
jgi:cell division topological specificity factor MinE